jgi:PAS domain S-box-containing protein
MVVVFHENNTSDDWNSGGRVVAPILSPPDVGHQRIPACSFWFVPALVYHQSAWRSLGVVLESSRKPRILVVEDEEPQAAMITFLLSRSLGAQTETADTLAKARQKLSSNTYDLITLDYQLPDGLGLDLMADLGDGEEGRPAVVVVTGHGDENVAVAAFKQGASGYVVKDKRLVTLLVEEVRSALARAGLQRAEAALEAAEKRTRDLHDAASFSIMVFDRDGELININAAAIDMVGERRNPDEIRFNLFDEDYLSEDEKQRLRRGETLTTVYELDFERLRRDSHSERARTGVIHVDGTITPILEEGAAEPGFYVCQAIEVTDRVLADRVLRAQYKLATEIPRTESLEQALEKALDATLDATGLDSGGIYVVQEDTNVLELVCYRGLSEEFARLSRRFDMASDRAALVMKGEPVYASYPTPELKGGDAEREGLKAIAAVPLVVAGKVIGCINVASHQKEEIPLELRGVIETLAAESAQAIDRERSARALAESEKRLRDERDRISRVLDSLPVGVVLLGADGRSILQNSRAAEMIGLSGRELGERQATSSEWAKTIATREPVVGARLAGLDGRGERRYVIESAVPLFDEDGEIEMVIMSLEDMTELRNAIVAAEKAEHLQRRTIETLNEGIWVIDSRLDTTYVSDRMADMLGYEPAEMLGRNLFEFVDESGRPVLEENMRMRQRGIITEYDFDWVKKDGSRVHTSIHGVPYLDESGEFVGAQAAILDISGRKEMEEALRDSLALYRTLVVTSPDSVATSDLEGRITFVSRRTLELHGYDDPSEIEGEPALVLIHPDDRERAMANLARTLEEDIVRGVEYKMLKKDGGTFTGALNAAVVRGVDGQPTGFIATTRDVSSQRQAEKKLRSLNAELDGYAHVVSHDLKGPISALIAAASLLNSDIEGIDDDALKAELAEAGEVIAGSARRSFDLINDLLVLAESGQEPRFVERVSVDDTVKLILEEKKEVIDSRGVRVERSEDLGHIEAERTHIYQLFSNLIGNAVQHSDAQEPVLTIKRHETADPGELRYSVCDNGSGIPAELLERVFEPFARAKGGGTGLGLSIAQRVVNIYGGSIRAYNDDGACFEVVLRDYEKE